MVSPLSGRGPEAEGIMSGLAGGLTRWPGRGLNGLCTRSRPCGRYRPPARRLLGVFEVRPGRAEPGVYPVPAAEAGHRGRAALLSLGAGVAGAGPALFAAFWSGMRATRSRLAGQSHLVGAARGPVEVAEPGTGPPALVVHGTAGGFDMGLMASRGVRGDGCRVIARPRFGYLRTPRPADAPHAAQAGTLASCSMRSEYPARSSWPYPRGLSRPRIWRFATRGGCRHWCSSPLAAPPPKPGAPAGPGPPGFVPDYVLASDFLAWAIAHLVPNLLVRAAGVPPALDRQLAPERRTELVTGSSPRAPATWGSPTASAPPLPSPRPADRAAADASDAGQRGRRPQQDR